jgi:hypothetical protein
MSAYTAILRAADHIEANPRLFDFERTKVPGNCRTPGCALGWIGHFAGRTKARIRARFSLPFMHRGIAIVTSEGSSDPVLNITARVFYERMDNLAIADWRRNPIACAIALRHYAQRYHEPLALDRAYVKFRESLDTASTIVRAD